MIPDWRANCVCLSGVLPKRFPGIYGRLKRLLDPCLRRGWGIALRLLEGTRDIWASDYCPLQVAPGRLVKFRYRPDYLRAQYRHLITDDSVVDQFQDVGTCHMSPIILDGGNVAASGESAILTDKVFRENPHWARTELQSELQRLLGVRRCLIIPSEPGDPFGHADGVVHFLDAKRVAVNDYSAVDPVYGRRLYRLLSRFGLAMVKLPYSVEDKQQEGIPSAVGNYVNFLRIGRLILLPAYGTRSDQQAREALTRACPGTMVAAVRCAELAREGGVLHCISRTIQVS